MDRAISVGDLVMVVRTCCDAHYNVIGGAIFTVSKIDNSNVECEFCGWTERKVIRAIASKDYTKDRQAAPFSWLKRIPPASDLGLLDEREEEGVRV